MLHSNTTRMVLGVVLGVVLVTGGATLGVQMTTDELATTDQPSTTWPTVCRVVMPEDLDR